MDLAAILKAAASVAKPEPYKVGESTLYLRRFTTADRTAFLEQLKDDATRALMDREWVVAYGLADANNTPLFPNPPDGKAALQYMLVEDQEAIELLVYKRLGIQLEGAEKKG